MVTTTEDYYATLGVSPHADQKAIEAAYRALARRLHPDLNPSPMAAAQMVGLNQAYDVLRNPASRALYDRERLQRLQAPRVVSPPPTPARPAPHFDRQVFDDAEPEETPAPAWTPVEDTDRGRWSLTTLLAGPVILAVVAAVGIFLWLGPLAQPDDAPPVTAPEVDTGGRTPQTATPLAAVSATPLAQTVSKTAERDKLLITLNEAQVAQREADVTGDGISELLVLAQPKGCSPNCRNVLHIIGERATWEIDDLGEVTISNISLSPPGFELMENLKLKSEADCCPSTARVSFYRWTGDGFSLNGVYFEALGTETMAPEDAVRRFYSKLGSASVYAPYGLTSRHYQETHPFESWAAGFQSTTKVEVQSLTVPAPGVVEVAVVATDTVGGKKVKHQYAGQWRLVQTPLGPRLDEGGVTPVDGTTGTPAPAQ